MSLFYGGWGGKMVIFAGCVGGEKGGIFPVYKYVYAKTGNSGFLRLGGAIFAGWFWRAFQS